MPEYGFILPGHVVLHPTISRSTFNTSDFVFLLLELVVLKFNWRCNIHALIF